jgi:serine/threonine protein kinase
MTVARLQRKWNFVMEYMERGDILTKWEDTGQFSEEVTQFCAAELTVAVEFLHKCGIILRWAAFVFFCGQFLLK